MSQVEVESLRAQAFKMSRYDQFRLASFIAENVGYVLALESHVTDQSALEDRVAALETRMAILLPDRSDDV